jgi:hypothetical protein
VKEPDERNTVRFDEIAPDLDALQRNVPVAVATSGHPLLTNDSLLRDILITQARLAGLTLDTIRLAAHHRESDAVRTPFILAALSPLVRELLDQVFTLAFLFEDLPTRWIQFKKGGWRDLRRQNEVLHRHDGDEIWRPFIEANDHLLGMLRRAAAITEQEETVGGTVRWPNAGAMASQCPAGELKDYLTHLDEWFYRELSQTSHAQFVGLLNEAPFLNVDRVTSGRSKFLFIEQKRALVAFRGIGLTLAVFSELDIALKLGLAGPLLSLWRKAVSVQPEILELFTMRYERKVGGVEAKK